MAAPFQTWLSKASLVIGIVFITFLISACRSEPPAFQGSDISDTDLGQDLAMVDNNGNLLTLADFQDKVLLVFFGFTHCPDVCPTSIAQIAYAIELLDDDADQVQVVMITVDPERDTPEILHNYVTAFHPSFMGLSGSAEQLAKTAQSFRAFYVKVPGKNPDDYTMDHGSSIYLLDKQGKARVLLPSQAPADAIAHDLQLLL